MSILCDLKICRQIGLLTSLIGQFVDPVGRRRGKWTGWGESLFQPAASFPLLEYMKMCKIQIFYSLLQGIVPYD